MYQSYGGAAVPKRQLDSAGVPRKCENWLTLKQLQERRTDLSYEQTTPIDGKYPTATR